MRNLDLKLLAIFDTLLEERNVTRAAGRLHTTQSAVSHALAKLRRTFDDPLFVPTREGMAPTARALELAAPLREALERVRGALAPRAPFDPSTCTDTVNIATNDYVSFVLAPRLMREIERRAPRLQLRFAALDAATDWARLDDGSLDMALAYFRETPGHLHARPLFHERYVCIARRGHPGTGKRLTLARYLALRHIVMFPYITGLIDRRLQERGLARQVALAIPQFLMIPELVAGSDHVATIGERVATSFAKRLPLTVHALPYPVEKVAISMVWHPRRHAEPSHQWLRGLIAEVAAAV